MTFDFSKDIESTTGSVKGLAKKALKVLGHHYHNALHQTYDQMQSSTQDIAQDNPDSEQNNQASSLGHISSPITASGVGAKGIIANLVLDKDDPTEEDINTLGDFNKEQFLTFLKAVEETEHRLVSMQKIMKAALKNSDFLDAVDRTDPKITDLLSDIDETKLIPIQASMLKNSHGEVTFWQSVIGTQNPNTLDNKYLEHLMKISRLNQAKNLANTANGKNKIYYEGSGLIQVIRGELQILEIRIAILKEIVSDHISKLNEDIKQKAKKAKLIIEGPH